MDGCNIGIQWISIILFNGRQAVLFKPLQGVKSESKSVHPDAPGVIHIMPHSWQYCLILYNLLG